MWQDPRWQFAWIDPWVMGCCEKKSWKPQPWISLGGFAIGVLAGLPLISTQHAIATTAPPLTVVTAETQVLPAGPGAFVPDFPTFNSELLDQQLSFYSNYLLSNGPPDVMIVGSSRALQGINPTVLQEALAQRGLPHATVYNFSINGATAQVVDFKLRQLLAREQLPRLVLWADGSRAFNSGRVDVTYNGIVASPGYQQLMAGNRPIPQLPPLAIYGDIEEFCVDSIHLAGTLFGRLPCLPPPDIMGASSPITRTLMATPQHPNILTLDERGFRAVTEQYNPATYYQAFPRVAGQYDSNYASFQLSGVQTQATVRVAQYLRDRQIPLIFVNLPLNRDYIDRFRQTREQQFQQHMQELANQGGFVFRDLRQQWTTQHSYFADPSHLNQNGAQAVAEYLARDPGIPWENLIGAGAMP